MNSNFQIPNFGNPPINYDRQALANLILKLNVMLTELKAPGALRAETLNLSNLPTSAAGLRVGDVWNDTGILTIVT